MRNHFLPLALLAACGGSSSTIAPIEKSTTTTRNLSPTASASDQTTLVDGNDDFAFRLYHSLAAASTTNLVYSPYSISIALGMTYAGAANTTATQMASTLSYTLPAAQLASAFDAVDLALDSRGQNDKGADGGPFALKIANNLWADKTQTFLPAYLDTLEENYGAGVNLVDFVDNADGARVTINNAVANETGGKITNLLPNDSVDASTRLVLTNAVYLDAAWSEAFPPSTSSAAFTKLDGSTVSSPIMTNAALNVNYAVTADYTAVDLPYSGDQLSMTIVMPTDYATFEAAIDRSTLQTIFSQLAQDFVALTMPKVSFSGQFDLADTLQALGMTDAFVGGVADFSGMDGTRDLYIQDVIHKAFIGINEAGTIAAAATAVSVGATAEPIINATIVINHPFLFFIRDIGTGTILFQGRVLDPTAT